MAKKSTGKVLGDGGRFKDGKGKAPPQSPPDPENVAPQAAQTPPARKAPRSKKARAVVLARREVKVHNLNFSPELSGDKLVERADLTLEFLAEEDDISELLNTRGNPLQVLWDKNGEPQLRELDGPLALDLKILGECQLESVNGDIVRMFERATLKKVKLLPMLGFKASVTCQIRVDPTDNLEWLAELVIARKCVMDFAGEGAAEKDTGQGKLNV